jgi:hypothetical protein
MANTPVRCPTCRKRRHADWGRCPSCSPMPWVAPPEPEIAPEKPDVEYSLPLAEAPTDLYRDWSHDTGEDEFDRQEYPWL